LLLHRELDNLFSASIRTQALAIKPEAVDACAINDAVGALLRLRDQPAEQIALVNKMHPQTAAGLCRWMGDSTFWGQVGGINRH